MLILLFLPKGLLNQQNWCVNQFALAQIQIIQVQHNNNNNNDVNVTKTSPLRANKHIWGANTCLYVQASSLSQWEYKWAHVVTSGLSRRQSLYIFALYFALFEILKNF